MAVAQGWWSATRAGLWAGRREAYKRVLNTPAQRGDKTLRREAYKRVLNTSAQWGDKTLQRDGLDKDRALGFHPPLRQRRARRIWRAGQGP